MDPEERDALLAKLRTDRYELLTQYRELQEDLEMIAGRIPTLVPEMEKALTQADKAVTKALDRINAFEDALESLA